jgi:hypothetical protein
MLLFHKRFHAGLVDGSVRLTFRLWDKPRVRSGGRYRVHPIGVVEVDEVRRVPLAEVGEADARQAGFRDRAELVGYMAPLAAERGVALRPSTEVYRVLLHHGGDGDRVAGALDRRVPAEEAERLDRALARLDRGGAWTREVLRLIAERPRVAASRLAASRGEERDAFKVNVRKLKRLGLTMSFEVGYELSPRGKAYLRRRRRPAGPDRARR